MQYPSTMAVDRGSLSARQEMVPCSVRLSSHVICGRHAVSNLQVSPQPFRSRRPQHDSCCGLTINVPRTSNGLRSSCNLVSANSQQERMTATVLHG